MIYILLAITLLFLILNFIIADYDYLHPATLFCAVFFLYVLLCVIAQSTYAINIHAETVMVLTAGFIVFTIVSLIQRTRRGTGSDKIQEYNLKYIKIPGVYIYILIVLQVITVLSFVKYLRAISFAFGGGTNITEMIHLYDLMTKFWVAIFNGLNVPVPILYRIFNPITNAGAHIVLYVMVNNYVVCKKIEIKHLIVIGLLCIIILLNGSRSPLFRVFTMILLLLYVFYYRKNKKRRTSLRSFFSFLFAILVISVMMILALNIIGRNQDAGSIFHYIFIYTGAPIVNLDSYLKTVSFMYYGQTTSIFGEHTFVKIYAYISKLFNVKLFKNFNFIGGFNFSDNGIEIGNVYTMFYTFVYDFGFYGVIPLTLIIAIYYIRNYYIVYKEPSDSIIDFRLLIYSYLFNDLIMLAFSNRFFDTICDAPFIKLLILAWLIDGFFIERKLRLGKFVIFKFRKLAIR